MKARAGIAFFKRGLAFCERRAITSCILQEFAGTPCRHPACFFAGDYSADFRPISTRPNFFHPSEVRSKNKRRYPTEGDVTGFFDRFDPTAMPYGSGGSFVLLAGYHWHRCPIPKLIPALKASARTKRREATRSDITGVFDRFRPNRSRPAATGRPGADTLCRYRTSPWSFLTFSPTPDVNEPPTLQRVAPSPLCRRPIAPATSLLLLSHISSTAKIFLAPDLLPQTQPHSSQQTELRPDSFFSPLGDVHMS